MSGSNLFFQAGETKSSGPHNNSSQTKPISNVKVICRIKPLSNYQEPIGTNLTYPDMKIDKHFAQISIPQPRQQTTKTFTFNRIYTDEPQQNFVTEVCDPIINRALFDQQGYLIFSYGVTNSGKTHTILGNQNQPGILPYLVKKLSQQVEVYLSAIQLYNDDFFSLTNKEKLHPRELGGFLDFNECAVMEKINCENMEQKFKQFINNRTQNETKLNSKSSRSHAIFRIKAGNVVIGVVDLAGSQRTNRVFASIDQTSNINKSLLCLGRCIKALNENPESHLPIPYRQSKLTKVLIQYFAAKVQVLMIANINQSQNCFHQNMKVLDYAVLAKDIRHCSTQSSLKKSQFKFAKSNKIDVFEALYKSATKSAFAHKSLKSSRSKINQNLQKSVKATQTNKRFAKALKTQQLQMFIEKFESSQETFDYMIQYMHEKQNQEDNSRIQAIKSSEYQSPFEVKYRRVSQKIIEKAEIGVGRSQSSIDNMKRQMYEKMKEQLKILLEEERLGRMQSKETEIGESFSKQFSKSQTNNFAEMTPQKIKQPTCQQQNFVIKTSSAIYSSVKKILSQKVHSIKNIWPSFKKASLKNQKLSFCSYNNLYESLFKIESAEEKRDSNSSSFSFDGKIKKSKQKRYASVDCEVQVNNLDKQKEQFQKQTQDTCTQTDDEASNPDLPDMRVSSQLQVAVKDKEILSESPEKQNIQINEASDQQSIIQKKQKHQNKEKQKVGNKRTKKRGAAYKSKGKQAAMRVAEMRKFAAKLCRQQSRTPLKKRLRNHKNQ